MSGLEKFEASESWRSNLKKLMFIERKVPVKKTVTIGETQRCSLDIADDLQNLIKERRIQIELEKQTTIESLQSKRDPNSAETMSHFTPHFDDTCYGASQDLPFVEKISDESFEAMEKMCDKTASDPNSTLFQYLHSDHKEQVLADAKKRSTGDGVEESVNRDPLLAKFSDCTLLDDIEAPSRIWENTMVVETGLIKTSPVKMIGLLRPSTIMEEACDESTNSDNSSHMSFQTATKGLASDISSIYDTAHESTVTSTRSDVSGKRRKEEEIYVDDILKLAIERSREMAAEASLLPHGFVSEPQRTICYNDNTSEGKEETAIDLIDFKKTFHYSPHASMIGETAVDIVVVDDDEEQSIGDGGEEEESVIDILSDEEEIEEDYSDIERKDLSTNMRLLAKYETSGFDDGTFEENKENVTQDSLSCDKSMKFNDTMEEVEYMLKKGMEYMAARDLQSAQPAVKSIDTTHVPPPIQTLPFVNPVKPIYPSKQQPKTTTQLRTCKTQANSPAPNIKKPALGTGSIKKVKESSIKTHAKSSQTPSNCLPIGVKAFPKFDVFGGRSPLNFVNHPRQKELSSKQTFSHIVSPIGAYMKKTASTPLMSTAKMKNANSTAFSELEYESRLYVPKFGASSASTQSGLELAALPGLSGVPQTLPKRAYISSELKHIVDERTPFTIPGGKKIQKYLESAMMPAVLRHDGKMKFPGAPNIPNTTHTFSQQPKIETSQPSSVTSFEINAPIAPPSSRRNNASLADLSVMSGDVSMYTIMDAQKF